MPDRAACFLGRERKWKRGEVKRRTEWLPCQVGEDRSVHGPTSRELCQHYAFQRLRETQETQYRQQWDSNPLPPSLLHDLGNRQRVSTLAKSHQLHHLCHHCHMTPCGSVWTVLGTCTPDSLCSFIDVVHARVYFDAELESLAKVFVCCLLLWTWHSGHTVLMAYCCWTTIHMVQCKISEL